MQQISIYIIILMISMTLIHLFNFIILKRLKKSKVDHKLRDLLRKVFEDSQFPPPQINTDNIKKNSNYLNSYYDKSNGSIYVNDGMLSSDNLLATFIFFHELGHYLQQKESNKFFLLFEKYYSVKYLKLLSLVALTYILIIKEDMNFYNLVGITIILTTMFILSIAFELLVFVKLESDANFKALRLIQKQNIICKDKLARIILSLNIKNYMDIIFISLAYILVLLKVFDVL